MKFEELGLETGKTLLLLPGTACTWQINFAMVIDDLKERYHLICVNYDGFDGDNSQPFTDMITVTEKIEAYILQHHGALFRGEAFHAQIFLFAADVQVGPDDAFLGGKHYTGRLLVFQNGKEALVIQHGDLRHGMNAEQQILFWAGQEDIENEGDVLTGLPIGQGGKVKFPIGGTFSLGLGHDPFGFGLRGRDVLLQAEAVGRLLAGVGRHDAQLIIRKGPPQEDGKQEDMQPQVQSAQHKGGHSIHGKQQKIQKHRADGIQPKENGACQKPAATPLAVDAAKQVKHGEPKGKKNVKRIQLVSAPIVRKLDINSVL